MLSTQAQARAEADTAALQAQLEQESAARQRLDDMLTAAEAVRAGDLAFWGLLAQVDVNAYSECAPASDVAMTSNLVPLTHRRKTATHDEA